MDLIIVGIIVAGAVFFSVRSFIKIFKGKGDCSCGIGCSCFSKDSCNLDFSVKNNNKN